MTIAVAGFVQFVSAGNAENKKRQLYQILLLVLSNLLLLILPRNNIKKTISNVVSGFVQSVVADIAPKTIR